MKWYNRETLVNIEKHWCVPSWAPWEEEWENNVKINEIINQSFYSAPVLPFRGWHRWNVEGVTVLEAHQKTLGSSIAMISDLIS